MRLRDKVVVPDLSPAAQARVERQFIDAVRAGEGRASALGEFARGFSLLAAGIAVAGVAIAIAININGALENRAIIAASVQIEATEISTSSDTATLRLGDATIEVGTESELVLLRSANGEIGVALRRGTVHCEVEPRPNRPTFWVGADDVTVRVVGTVFTVSHDPLADASLRVRVGVERGRVAVTQAGNEVFVDAGSQWSALDGVTQAVAEARRADSIDDTEDETAIDEVAAGEAEGRLKKPATSPSESLATTAKTAKPRAETSSKQAGLPGPRRMSPPENDPALLAAMELDSSDPRAAVIAYTKIATRSRGKLASFALYSRAYVEYVVLGDGAAALRTLDLYRRRFPKARELESALWLQISALCTRGQEERCRAAAHSYVARYPSGRFAAGAQKIIDSL